MSEPRFLEKFPPGVHSSSAQWCQKLEDPAENLRQLVGKALKRQFPGHPEALPLCLEYAEARRDLYQLRASKAALEDCRTAVARKLLAGAMPYDTARGMLACVDETVGNFFETQPRIGFV